MQQKLIAFTILCIILCFPSWARGQDDNLYNLKYRPFRTTIIPGIGTNGMDANEYYSRYSLNILAGFNGGLDRGIELGGLVNVNGYFARGFQLAGAANVSGRETFGIQLAGLLNYSGRSMQGIQFSGVSNISRGNMQGIQLSGLANITSGSSVGIEIAGLGNFSENDMRGLLFSGVLNIAGENMQGLSFSGIGNIAQNEMQGISSSGVFNIADQLQGIMLSGVNVARNMEGMQIGTLNIAENGMGLQLGLVNVAKEFEGVPLGLFSYYGDGRRNVDVWTSDGGFTNMGLKLGTHQVYNTLSVGFNPFLDRDVWQLGWSVGRLNQHPSHFTYSDVSVFKINEGAWSADFNGIFKYRYLFGKNLSDGMKIYGGPTLNLMVSGENESNDYTWYRLFDFERKQKEFVGWIGYSIGFELF